MSTVTLKNVYKIYENKEEKAPSMPAVSDFSMHIEDKEFIVYSNLDLNGAESLEKTATSITLNAKLNPIPKDIARYSLTLTRIASTCSIRKPK